MGVIRINSEDDVEKMKEKGVEYRNVYAFMEELSDSKQDILEADTQMEKEKAEQRYNELNSLITRNKDCTHTIFAFRDGLNVHCEFHTMPDTVMFVWFEDTEQKRVIPKLSEPVKWNLGSEDGVFVPGMRDFDEFGVYIGGYIVSRLSLEDMYFVLNGQEYLFTEVTGGYSNYSCLSKSYCSTGFKTLVFGEQCLKSGFEAVDLSIYEPPLLNLGNWWIHFNDEKRLKEWFLPWYLGKALGF